MRKLKILLFVITFFFSTIVLASAFGRPGQPINNITNQSVTTSSGKSLSAAQVSAMITKAATGKKWVVVKKPDGNLAASLSWKGSKHTIIVDIVCWDNAYSIIYKDSINMNYEVIEGVPHIHPFYNRRVGDLNGVIKLEALTM